jgi:hypothetical protein
MDDILSVILQIGVLYISPDFSDSARFTCFLSIFDRYNAFQSV